MAKNKSEKKQKRLKQRQEQVQAQREAAKRKHRNKKIINYSIVGVIILIIGFWSYSQWTQAQGPGQYDDFAMCLTESGVAMYGTDWCPHCQEQKRLFGNSFSLVTYINCDTNSAACNEQGVTGYPTWISDDGRVSGTQQLESLAEFSGCELPQNG